MQKKGSKTIKRSRNVKTASSNTRTSKNRSNLSNISNFKVRSKVDMPLVITVLMLVAIGIIMVLSASAPSALADFGNSYHYVITQGIAAILGFVAMIFLSKVDYRIYQKFYWWIYAFSILIIFSVLVPGIGMEVNGAKRWIKLGFQIQPSEITKIGLIISLAGYFSDTKRKYKNSFLGDCLIPLIMALIPIGLLYVVQNHLSAGIIIGIVSLIIIVISGCE